VTVYHSCIIGKRVTLHSGVVIGADGFGYYIEVTKANTSLVPPDYIRKQTLVNAERYTTPLLKDYEHTVLTAEEHRRALEYDLFVAFREQMAAHLRRIQRTASFIADLDALLSLAEVATRYDYTCPIVDDGGGATDPGWAASCN